MLSKYSYYNTLMSAYLTVTWVTGVCVKVSTLNAKSANCWIMYSVVCESRIYSNAHEGLMFHDWLQIFVHICTLTFFSLWHKRVAHALYYSYRFVLYNCNPTPPESNTYTYFILSIYWTLVNWHFLRNNE